MASRSTGVTTRHLCLTFGISKTTAIRWANLGCPHTITPKGFRWDLPAVRRWFQATHAVPNADLAAAKLRATHLRCEELEYRLAREREQYVLKTTADTYLNAAALQISEVLLALPARLAAAVASESDQNAIHALMTKEIRRTLTDLANNLVRWNGGNPDL